MTVRTKLRGRQINEEELRAYQKCSEYMMRFNLKESLPENVELIKHAYTVSIGNYIRKYIHQEDQDSTVAKVISHAINYSILKMKLNDKYLESELSELKTRTLLALNTIYQELPLNQYVPLYAGFPLNFAFNRQALQFSVSSLMKHKRFRQLHYVDFINTSHHHASEWDASTIVKLNYLEKLWPEKVDEVKAHVYWFATSGEHKHYIYSSRDKTKEDLKFAARVIESMKQKIHYPIYGCTYAGCPARRQCVR